MELGTYQNTQFVQNLFFLICLLNQTLHQALDINLIVAVRSNRSILFNLEMAYLGLFAGGDTNPLKTPIFARFLKNCMKLKKFGSIGIQSPTMGQSLFNVLSVIRCSPYTKHGQVQMKTHPQLSFLGPQLIKKVADLLGIEDKEFSPLATIH